MRRIISTSLLYLAFGAAQAGTVSTDYLDLTISGGLNAGYFYSGNMYDPSNVGVIDPFLTGASTDRLVEDRSNYLLSDMLLELSALKDDVLGVSAFFGLGNLKMVSIFDGNGNWALNRRYDRSGTPLPGSSTVGATQTDGEDERSSFETQVNELVGQGNNDDLRIYYGFARAEPFPNVAIEAGKLPTNFGYEVAPTYANWNALLGMLWIAQPHYYNGLRSSFQTEYGAVYLDVNDDTSLGGDGGWAIGLRGEYGLFRYGAGFQNSDGGRNLVDVMFEARFPMVITAANFNYFVMGELPAGQTDKTGYGLALYAIPHLDKIFVPVRFELVRDGDTNVWGVDRAWSLTVTPTYYLTGNAYVRAEWAYISSNNYIFREHSALPQNADYRKTSITLQLGFQF